MSLVTLTVAAAMAGTPLANPHEVKRLLVSPAELFKVAEIADQSGDEATATAALQALTQDRSIEVRSEARFRLAQRAHAKGRKTSAAMLLRRILDEQPGAQRVRLELARLLVEIGDVAAAQRELHAAQAAGLPWGVARLVDRYSQALRAVQPAGASIEIAIAPDTNISRATRSDSLGTVFGDFDIDDDNKAKSGLGLALRAQAFRRFGLGDDENSFLVRAGGSGDFYAKTQFNDVAVDLAAGPELWIGRSRLNLEAGATQRWFGQKPSMRSARIGASLTRRIDRRSQLRLSGTASLVDNQRNHLQDGRAFSARIEAERALSPTTGVQLSLSGERQALEDPGYSTTGWRAGLLGWREVGRSTFTAALELGRLNADDRLLLFPEARRDRYRRLSLGISFRQLSIRGFAPLIRFSAERNRSSIEIYDYSRRRTEFGIVRAF